MKSAERSAEDKLTAPGPHGFRAHPGQEQPQEVAVREPLAATSDHVKRVRAVDAFVLKSPAGVGARQRAQREQPSHEPNIRVRVPRADELRHLVEVGEVVPRLRCRRGGNKAATAWQLDRPGYVAEGNEAVSFTFHYCGGTLRERGRYSAG